MDTARILAFIGFMGLIIFIYYRWATRKKRLAAKVMKQGFPKEWRRLLATNVAFYNGLTKRQKRGFEHRIAVFLAQTKIEGVETEVDDLSCLLIAASAVMLTWGYKDWEYPNLGEVYLTDGAVAVHSPEPGRQNITAGQIKPQGSQHMVVLSKQALLQGFANPKDSRNVGLHEFAHLLDEQDGTTDGLPDHYLSGGLAEAWQEVMQEKTELIKDGKAGINPYGATNGAEFFAVMTEYFFERPRKLLQQHPRLYRLLAHTFKQHPAKKEPEELVKAEEPGRNDPCPCGSGEKYKKCCLSEASA
ncbi:hypothetical protein D770_18875 [Flammeovirgaceae bacterium 311]|nr:hypothetical protein D770_18875 [Flammeovirgaceae bacterium 311]